MHSAKNNVMILNPIKKAPGIPSMVAKQIIEHIKSGTLKPGDRLPSENDMTKQFGISRISLRESLQLLEAKGYILSHGRKGRFVNDISGQAFESTIEVLISIDHKKIWELLAVRRIIDSEAARLAARHSTKRQLAKLKMLKRDMEMIGIQNVLSTREGGKIYARFYNDLADATNNSIFSHLMKSISSLLKGVLPYSRQKLMNVPGASENFYTIHIKILKAIEKGDAELARISVIEHIDWLEKTLRKILK